jgi:hypothetical protein
LLYRGPHRICKERLWKRASLFVGTPLGNLEWVNFLGDFERRVRFFYQEKLYRGIRETRKRMLSKRVTLFIGGPFGETGGGLFFWGLLRYKWRTVETEHLFLWELCEGNQEEGLFY